MAEKKKGFELGDVLKETLKNVSDSDTSGREQIEYIDLTALDADANNFYSLDGLDQLVANIELIGLQQPLRVRPNPDMPGRYFVVSGHRRRAALMRLAEEGQERFAKAPCIVEQTTGSAALQELRLIYANSDTRRMSSADLSKQAERVEALLYQLKEEGYEFPGRMRDHVAEACKVSATKLATLKVIREKLTDCWRPSYERGDLSESAAHALAVLPPERQLLLYQKFNGTNPVRIYEGTVNDYARKLDELDGLTCRKVAGGEPCSYLEARQQRVLADSQWDFNRCKTCCDKCSQLQTCKRACPKLADKIKKLKADAKAQKLQEQLAQEEDRPKVEFARMIWTRWDAARQKAGKTVEAAYKAADKYYSESADGEIAALLSGEKKIKADDCVPYRWSRAGDLMPLVKAADFFDVSTDYLLGRSEDMAPTAARWQPGRKPPAEDCDAVCVFGFDDGAELTQLATWRFGKWNFYANGGIGTTIDAECLRWIQLPNAEEAT